MYLQVMKTYSGPKKMEISHASRIWTNEHQILVLSQLSDYYCIFYSLCENDNHVFSFVFYLQCPKCNICIEKNGGCNHMQCYHCKHDFCWMCLGDWKTHGSEYYECSRYKENPNIAHESVHAQAREALKKYLHYYERVSAYLLFFSGIF